MSLASPDRADASSDANDTDASETGVGDGDASNMPASETGLGEGRPYACTYCGRGTNEERGRMTLWIGDRLLVIEDVPARVCSGCGETFYEDDILARVERLQTAGLDRPEPTRTIRAPVFAWDDL